MSAQEKEIRRILESYLQGKATEEERILLDRFFETYKHEAESEFPEEHLSLYLAEQEIKSRIDQAINPRKASYPYLRLAAAITGFLIVAAGLFFFIDKSTPIESATTAFVTKSTQKGQKSTITLPDGSTVRLNSNSSVTFPSHFSLAAREISFSGEGFFEITHDPSRPFTVKTGDTKTTVLGTTFNVRAIENNLAVITLVTGKVKVSDTHIQKEVQLTPNHQAVVLQADKNIEVTRVDVTRFIEWKDNILTFDATPLADAVQQLEDWYGVDITIKNKGLSSCKITGRYENESLENVMRSFQFMLRGNYVMEGKKVVLSGKGCSF